MEDFYVVREHVTDEKEREAVYDILLECDNDFIPPLSYRAGTRQTDFAHRGSTHDGVKDYFDALMQQHVLLCKRDGEVIAFMSFRPHEIIEHFEDRGRVCYLSTMCVKHTCRGQGISPRLYNTAKEWAHQHGNEITLLRTWSTNAAQMHLMEKLGYKLALRIENDRGQGVHTEYYIEEE